MIRITLVRHGETGNNRARIVQGQDPTQGKLTAKGLRQAQLLGQRLASVPFDAAYCSPLERAVLTLAQVLAARNGDRTLPLVFAPELREINLGTLHGRPHGEWKAAIAGDPMAWRAPQGESWNDVQERVTAYLRRVVLSAGHRNILIVAHGGVNRGLKPPATFVRPPGGSLARWEQVARSFFRPSGSRSAGIAKSQR